ncbi:MAG: HI1506-related protein [Sterolibacterium sp.]
MVTVTVTAKRDNFRRCGIGFGKAPVEITVSPEEAEILQAEPMLTVSVAAEAE